MRFHLLPPWRLFGLALPLAMIVLGAVIFPTFHEAGLPWWPLFIMALPTLLAAWLAVEIQLCTLTLDDRGARYRGVGYRVGAPWAGIEGRLTAARPGLLVVDGESGFIGPIRIMAAVLNVIWPQRADRAARLMGWISLSAFPPSATQASRDHLTAHGRPI